MAFTEAQLQAQIAADGAGCKITQFINIGTTKTDVYVENMNSTSRKFGGLQIAQTNTAAQAAALLRTALSA